MQNRAKLVRTLGAQIRAYTTTPAAAAQAGHVVDLRSDTVTRPSARMKEVMVNCALGDDVYGQDPTVNYVEGVMAKFFGKEAAVYMPSGTQSNLCAMLTNCREKGESALLGDKCHIYNYERGGIAGVAGIFPQVVPNLADGTFDLNVLQKLIPPPTEHIAQPTVICLENSQGGCSGAPVSLEFVKSVKKIAKKNKLRMHLDGARLLNALVT